MRLTFRQTHLYRFVNMELLGRFELPTSSLPSVPDNLFVLLFVHVFSKTAYFLQTFICK